MTGRACGTTSGEVSATSIDFPNEPNNTIDKVELLDDFDLGTQPILVKNTGQSWGS